MKKHKSVDCSHVGMVKGVTASSMLYLWVVDARKRKGVRVLYEKGSMIIS